VFVRNGPSLRAGVCEEAVNGAFITNSNGSGRNATNPGGKSGGVERVPFGVAVQIEIQECFIEWIF
jgi:hypothetical protein